MNESVTQHPLVSSYLGRLARQAAPLAAGRRKELLQEIRSHIEVSLPARPSEAEVSALLDRLGTPDEIVDAELVDSGQSSGGRLRTAFAALRPWDATGLFLLLLGGAALPPVGYLVGAALVGLSPRWTPAARLLLVALPCAAALTTVIVLAVNGGWYSPADLLHDPRQTLTGIRDLSLYVLPYTIAQTLALIAVRLLPSSTR
ncbi:HAAS signaling domain-containing protein [Actinosynnema sp. CS-041913]|uniref:HAAS signaling domain-containing protein n=1 Tax=Actinosynnema sp. CS-041913 TaxID=3239917 RepID=UPI003D8F22D6